MLDRPSLHNVLSMSGMITC